MVGGHASDLDAAQFTRLFGQAAVGGGALNPVANGQPLPAGMAQLRREGHAVVHQERKLR